MKSIPFPKPGRDAIPVAIVCADLHLQEGAWSGRSIRGDSYYSLDQIVQLAVHRRVPLVAAGDILDVRRNNTGPVAALQAAVETLSLSSLDFFAIQGQHEMQSPPWIEVVGGTWFDASIDHNWQPATGVDIVGLDYRETDELAASLDPTSGIGEKIQQATVLVCHQVWQELMGPIGNPQGSMANVPLGPSLIITGDYHVAGIFQLTREDGEEVMVLSPGSTCMQSIDEPADKYAYVLYDDLGIEQVQLRTRDLIDMPTIADQLSVDAAVRDLPTRLRESEARADTLQLPDELRTPLVRISYVYDVPDVRARIQAAVDAYAQETGKALVAHLFWRELQAAEFTDPDVDNAYAVIDSGEVSTLRSELSGYLGRLERPELVGICDELLTIAEQQDGSAVVETVRKYVDSIIQSRPEAVDVSASMP